MRMRMIFVLGTAALLIACGGAETEADTASTATATTAATTTTATVAPTTATTVALTTTTAATTTTEAAPTATSVDATPIVGSLAAYNDGGEALFASGSVEAHWYQWNGFYVVLYRGFDATSGEAVCPGNSINVTGQGFIFISNSPLGGDADDICVGVPTLADGAARACDSLLYYVTQIPTTEDGMLYGSLEIGDADGFRGHTSQADSDLASTPEFEPGLDAYELPISTVDELGLVSCG